MPWVSTGNLSLKIEARPDNLKAFEPSQQQAGRGKIGYALKAGQLTYDCRYSTMHGMPVTGGRGFRGLKPL